LYGILKNDLTYEIRHRLGSLDFEIGEKAVGLQAADLFAFQTYQFGKQRIQRKQPMEFSELPPLLRQLGTNRQQGDDDFPFFDREGLNIALRNFPTHLRSPGWTKPVVRPRHISY
jgi:hypothetical protein